MKKSVTGKKGILIVLMLAVGLLTLSLSAWAKTEIIWWHVNTGFLGDRTNDLVNKFNASQSEYEVKATYKGGPAT